MARKQEYNWLDDPFNEKKGDKQTAGMSGGVKVALGCGCLLIVIGIIVLFLFVVANVVDILANG